MTTPRTRFKLAVVGAGAVGATFAYTAMLKGLAHELVLINRHRERAVGEVLDLNHGLPFAPPMTIRAGDWADCADAQVVVITAGTNPKPGQTRMDLAEANAPIVRELVDRIMAHNPDPILVLVTNPVDVTTWIALKHSGLAPGRVLGSGTVLDSARFRYLLSQHCGIDPHSIHGHVVGEHGDSEFPLWSRVNIAGVRLSEQCLVCERSCPTTMRDELAEQVRRAGFEVYERKGHTAYAIALAVNEIVQCIQRDSHTVLSVSSLVGGDKTAEATGEELPEVCLSLPCVVDAGGVERVLRPHLEADEQAKLLASARVIREAIDACRTPHA